MRLAPGSAPGLADLLRRRPRLGVVGAALSVALTLGASGCAVGGEDIEDGLTSKKDGGGDGSHDTAGGSDTGGPDGGTGKDTGATPDTGSTDTGATPDTGSGDTGSTDTGSGDTGTVDTGTPCTTLGATECKSSAEVLAAISGDTGSGTAVKSGSDGAFFRVTITEDDSSLLSSKDLKVRISLASPPGANFDLYVYKGKAKGDGGAVECATVAKSSTLTGGTDVVSLTWNDNRPIGGFDDSTPLSIEVRPTGTKCDPADTWTLTVEGNK